MRKTEEKTIGEYKYMCVQYDLITSLSVIRRLGKYVGKPAETFVKSLNGQEDMLNQKVEDLNWGQALTELCGSMEDQELFDFIKLCLKCVVIAAAPDKGATGNLEQEDILNQHFAAVGLGGLVKVIMFAVEVNYKTFLDGLTEVLPAGLLKSK